MALTMRVRATAVTKYDSGAEVIELKAIEDAGIPAADQLELGAPNAVMTVRIDNPQALGVVLPNNEYRVTFGAAP